jgi:hypothetical protein
MGATLESSRLGYSDAVAGASSHKVAVVRRVRLRALLHNDTW